MKTYCEICEEYDPKFTKTKCKLVKLKTPIPEALVIGEIKYEETITHRCKSCGYGYGTAKKKGPIDGKAKKA